MSTTFIHSSDCEEVLQSLDITFRIDDLCGSTIGTRAGSEGRRVVQRYSDAGIAVDWSCIDSRIARTTGWNNAGMLRLTARPLPHFPSCGAKRAQVYIHRILHFMLPGPAPSLDIMINEEF